MMADKRGRSASAFGKRPIMTGEDMPAFIHLRHLLQIAKIGAEHILIQIA